mgnify:FL=1
MIYKKIFSANTKFAEKEVFIYIPTDSDYAEVEKIVAPYIENMDNFKMVAEKKSYVTNVKAGKFLLKNNMNNNDIINSLRQPVETKLAFNNQERLEDFAGRIGSQIEADSTSLMKAFTDKKFLEDNGFTEENVLEMFIPNSYDFFWISMRLGISITSSIRP